MTEQPRAIHPQYGLQPTGIEGFDLWQSYSPGI